VYVTTEMRLNNEIFTESVLDDLLFIVSKVPSAANGFSLIGIYLNSKVEEQSSRSEGGLEFRMRFLTLMVILC
jgi:hypothetical protein